MKTATDTLCITNGMVLVGDDSPPIPNGCVIAEKGRITYVGNCDSAPSLDHLPADRFLRIDARGGTIMPGLVEAHFHATYLNVAALEDLDIKYPVEYVTLLAAANAKLALECGYTARHGRRLWVRMESPRRLCQGTLLLRQLRRVLPHGDHSLRDQNRLGNHGTLGGVRNAAPW